jgi:hypothetical protein
MEYGLLPEKGKRLCAAAIHPSHTTKHFRLTAHKVENITVKGKKHKP